MQELHVSTHAPTRGATCRCPRHTPCRCSFNPRAHEGRDVHTVPFIHAFILFQPTRPRGARHAVLPYGFLAVRFQPTRPRGARRPLQGIVRARRVSTHAPTRGATSQPSSTGNHSVFQPTRPRGARLTPSRIGVSGLLFQPTRPRGARHCWILDFSLLTLFQPTRPRGARRSYSSVHPCLHFVSTHAPTRGATGGRCGAQSHSLVSTHAPTRGATGQLDYSLKECCVSTHAPTRGATFSWPSMVRSGCFNPRAHEGRDGYLTNLCAAVTVSTHAPTRGATTTGCPYPPFRKFQPTRPRGARPIKRKYPVRGYSFNPRAHEGRDGASGLAERRIDVSTHAPTRGATPGA